MSNAPDFEDESEVVYCFDGTPCDKHATKEELLAKREVSR